MLRVRPLTMMVIMKITQAVESRAASSLYRYAFSSTNYHFFYSASASANVGLQRTAELNRNIQYQCEKVVHCVQASSPCSATETISSTADPATVPVGCSIRSQLIIRNVLILARAFLRSPCSRQSTQVITLKFTTRVYIIVA